MLSTQSYKCPFCGRYTKHIKITYLELEAFDQKRRSEIYKEENKVGNILGKGIINVVELTGFFRLLSKATGRSPYKCCECGFCAEWNARGEIC